LKQALASAYVKNQFEPSKSLTATNEGAGLLKILANSGGKQFCSFTARLRTSWSPREPGGTRRAISVRNCIYLFRSGAHLPDAGADFGTKRGVFAWTGDNLETERRIGGERLAKEIADLEASDEIRRYHIVAHSHGGNVVLHALRSLADDPKKLGAVVYLGTPVLCFPDRASWLNPSEVTCSFMPWVWLQALPGRCFSDYFCRLFHLR
jgi:pimeloyl-ACP methyl ester carboxylesterase